MNVHDSIIHSSKKIGNNSNVHQAANEFCLSMVNQYGGILFDNKREKLQIDVATWMMPPLQIMLSEKK